MTCPCTVLCASWQLGTTPGGMRGLHVLLIIDQVVQPFYYGCKNSTLKSYTSHRPSEHLTVRSGPRNAVAHTKSVGEAY